MEVQPKSSSANSSTSPISGWSLIVDDALDGADNMAIDGDLLHYVENSSEPCTVVRFYQWRRPTVSLGRNQKVDAAVDIEYCSRRGIDVVHRPTGGRAVLHDDELTYAVASNDSNSFGDSIYANYKSVSEALCAGFIKLGVPAVLAPETRKASLENATMDLPCFISPSRYELTVGGRKIVGSAQRRLRRGFLQHGSMPIACDREMLARATRMADSALLYQEMAGLSEFLPAPPSVTHMVEALVEGFKSRFGIEFSQQSRLTRVSPDVIKNRHGASG